MLGAVSRSSSRSNKPVGKQYESLEHYLSEEDIDPSICKHIELSHNSCQGYLIKRGGVHVCVVCVVSCRVHNNALRLLGINLAQAD